MAISQQEDHLVDPETDHPRALQSNEACNGLSFLGDSITDGDSNEEDKGARHGDKGVDGLTRPVAGLVVIGHISAGTLGDAGTLVKIESSDTSQAGVRGSLASVARFKTLLAFFGCAWPLKCGYRALGEALAFSTNVHHEKVFLTSRAVGHRLAHQTSLDASFASSGVFLREEAFCWARVTTRGHRRVEVRGLWHARSAGISCTHTG
jgi:hypothetical protein